MSVKTFRIKKEYLDKWLKALRSGEYEQARDALRTDDADGVARYCCLGVACEVWTDGKFDWQNHRNEGGEELLPGNLYLAAGIEGLAERNIERHGVVADSPDVVGGDLFVNYNPYLRLEATSLSTLNDEGCPFSQIADAIEASAEPY